MYSDDGSIPWFLIFMFGFLFLIGFKMFLF